MEYKQLLLTLIADDSGILNIYNAPLFRAAFLRLVQNKNPSLATNLHDSSERKPYFISALRPINNKQQVKKSRIRKEYVVKPGQKYVAKISIFNEELLEIFLNQLLVSSNVSRIKIGNMNFIIEKVEIVYYDFKKFFYQIRETNSAKIELLSPTFFKTVDGSGGIEFFPRPIIVFKFLVNHWKHFVSINGVMPPNNFLEWVNKKVRVSSFNIRSESSHVMKKTPIIGTVGWIKYNWKIEEKISKWVIILLKFGEYGGLGGLRTGGYGEIKVVF